MGKFREAASDDRAALSISDGIEVRVYYEDTDFSGVVYHASYLRFLERGRTEYLRKRGIEHQKTFAGGRAEGSYFVVRAMSLDFLRPALMDDLLRVETKIVSVGGAAIEMGQQISRRVDLLVTAKVKIAVVAGGRARRIPAEISACLRAGSEPADSSKINLEEGRVCPDDAPAGGEPSPQND